MTEGESLYILALKMTPGIGDILAKQLISYCGSAANIFEKKRGALLKIPSIGNKIVDSITSSKYLKEADEILKKCQSHQVNIVPYYHADYPEKLKLVNDAPLLIYTKGVKRFENRKMVGVVGTRNATEYGRQTTMNLVEDLKSHDPVIVSGLAYGIDITAHRAALKNGLATVAVLAGGLDTIYPAAHKKTAEEILEMGSWVSEQVPGTSPEPHYFPARNRIIAGMTDALIVVEAANKGGALITANIAYSYNREVFAVPGTLVHKYSEGCNALIRSQRANIYTSVKDLEYLLSWEEGRRESNKPILDLNAFELSERKIMETLIEFEAGLQLDELSWKTQISVNKTVGLLLNLEFAGFVKSLPGKRYVKI